MNFIVYGIIGMVAGFCVGWTIGRIVNRLSKQGAFDMDIISEEEEEEVNEENDPA